MIPYLKDVSVAAIDAPKRWICSDGSWFWEWSALKNLIEVPPDYTLRFRSRHLYLVDPDAPWCWNIYQHLPEQNHPNVGKYAIHGAYGRGSFCFSEILDRCPRWTEISIFSFFNRYRIPLYCHDIPLKFSQHYAIEGSWKITSWHPQDPKEIEKFKCQVPGISWN